MGFTTVNFTTIQSSSVIRPEVMTLWVSWVWCMRLHYVRSSSHYILAENCNGVIHSLILAIHEIVGRALLVSVWSHDEGVTAVDVWMRWTVTKAAETFGSLVGV